MGEPTGLFRADDVDEKLVLEALGSDREVDDGHLHADVGQVVWVR